MLIETKRPGVGIPPWHTHWPGPGLALSIAFSHLRFAGPSDVLGLSVYNQSGSVFEWKPGPVFATFAADENQSHHAQKPQSALQEAMGDSGR